MNAEQIRARIERCKKLGMVYGEDGVLEYWEERLAKALKERDGE